MAIFSTIVGIPEELVKTEDDRPFPCLGLANAASLLSASFLIVDPFTIVGMPQGLLTPSSPSDSWKPGLFSLYETSWPMPLLSLESSSSTSTSSCSVFRCFMSLSSKLELQFRFKRCLRLLTQLRTADIVKLLSLANPSKVSCVSRGSELKNASSASLCSSVNFVLKPLGVKYVDGITSWPDKRMRIIATFYHMYIMIITPRTLLKHSKCFIS